MLKVNPQSPEPEAIARAARCLRDGGLVAFPTETVYGLGVHALDRSAVLRLFEAKGRPANDPLIVHVAALTDAAALVLGLPTHADRLARAFWPGPLTLVMRRGPAVPDEVTAGLETVAIRVPAHPVAHALILASTVPIAAPSANLFSRPSPTRAEHVLQDLDGRIDMVVDGGATDVGVESTVVDLTTDPPVVLRAGAVSLESLRAVVPEVALAVRPTEADGNMPMPSPGLLSRHYSPRAPMVLYRGRQASTREAVRAAASAAIATGQRVGVLATDDDVKTFEGLDVTVAGIGDGSRAEHVASRLYAALRELDIAAVGLVLARDFEQEDGLWRAVKDRLQRAAGSVVMVPD
ncbi:MAG: threonylcarbamoyl-AMP synthase [Acidobacteria bacterium]|nr:threonylcarbamoyl-AMP synthase [Acidobacteriota bacterium]